MKEYDSGDWHVKEHANGWTEITGTLGVDYTATVNSPSTGYNYRTGTVTLPVALDINKPRVAMASDSSPGLSVFNTRMHSGGDVLTLTAGMVASSDRELPGYPTSLYVAGHKKA